METFKRKIGRIGDYGKTPIFEIRETEEGVFVQVSPVKLFEAESITFALSMGGGRSYELVKVLNDVWGKSSRKLKMVICGKDIGAIQISRKEGGDFLIKTGNVDGSGLVDIGCEVFFSKDSGYYQLLIDVFNAIEIDNKKYPMLAHTA